MYHVGLDVHWRRSSLCILNQDGKKIKEKTIKGHWDQVILELKKIDQPFQICYEASCGYGTLFDRLKRIARRVVVGHPGKMRLIYGNKRKTDRADAENLAKLLYLKGVPEVWVPSLDFREWRRMIEFRNGLVGKRTRVKNSLRALLRRHGVVAPRGLWTKKGLAWLSEVELPTEMADLEREMSLEELSGFEGRIGKVERMLWKIASKHPAIELLKSIPGVGIRPRNIFGCGVTLRLLGRVRVSERHNVVVVTAEAFVAYVGEADRFRQNKSIGCYLGLVPREDSSGGVERRGHITKDGPATVRKLLVEATWQAVRRSAKAKNYFDRVCGDQAVRRKVALVATAHYLARVMLAMMCSGEVWREDS